MKNIPVDSIKVKDRVRSDAGDIQGLMESIKRYGLLSPITVNEKNELIAGERRLRAAIHLGWHSIPAIVISGADPVTELEMEIEENVQRSGFTEEELVKAYTRLNKLKNPNRLVRIFRAIKAFFKRLAERIKSLFKREKEEEEGKEKEEEKDEEKSEASEQ